MPENAEWSVVILHSSSNEETEENLDFNTFVRWQTILLVSGSQSYLLYFYIMFFFLGGGEKKNMFVLFIAPLFFIIIHSFDQSYLWP